jgi:hypothetical protein
MRPPWVRTKSFDVGLIVLEEIALDGIGSVAEARHELPMSVVRVIAHQGETMGRYPTGGVRARR